MLPNVAGGCRELSCVALVVEQPRAIVKRDVSMDLANTGAVALGCRDVQFFEQFMGCRRLPVFKHVNMMVIYYILC